MSQEDAIRSKVAAMGWQLGAKICFKVLPSLAKALKLHPHVVYVGYMATSRFRMEYVIEPTTWGGIDRYLDTKWLHILSPLELLAMEAEECHNQTQE